MIGRLTGNIVEKIPPNLLINVNGVGYEVAVSLNTLFKLADDDSLVTLHTHLIVREDAQLLYGFYDQYERRLFRELIKVNGVGPKMAITLLSSIEPTVFIQCVMNQDTSSLVKLPGVGKKTAERLIIEMKDKLENLNSHDSGLLANQANLVSLSVNNARQDAVSALISLGYKPADAQKAINRIQEQDELTSEAYIKLALKQLAA